jgi:hypothetical protein
MGAMDIIFFASEAGSMLLGWLEVLVSGLGLQNPGGDTFLEPGKYPHPNPANICNHMESKAEIY